jgi:hypothetical protein
METFCFRGAGPLHYDVIIGTGARCLTWRFERHARGWRGQQITDHRRRYLTWSGPLSGGRGVVRVCARSRAVGCRHAQGAFFLLRPNPLVCLGMGVATGSYLYQHGKRVVVVAMTQSI